MAKSTATLTQENEMRQRKVTGGSASTPAAIAAPSTSAPSVVAAETKSQTSASFSSLDGAVVAALLVVGLATRLWGIEDPKGFVSCQLPISRLPCSPPPPLPPTPGKFRTPACVPSH